MSGWRKQATVAERRKQPLPDWLEDKLWAISPNAHHGSIVWLEGTPYRLGRRTYLSRSGATRFDYDAWHESHDKRHIAGATDYALVDRD